MFANSPGDLGSIPSRILPKTLKMVLDTSLLNTQQYKVCIKGKVEQSPLHLGVVAIEKGAFWSPSTIYFISIVGGLCWGIILFGIDQVCIYDFWYEFILSKITRYHQCWHFQIDFSYHFHWKNTFWWEWKFHIQ